MPHAGGTMRKVLLFAVLASLTIACGPCDVLDHGPPWVSLSKAQLAGVWRSGHGALVISFDKSGGFRVNNARLLDPTQASSEASGTWVIDSFDLNNPKSQQIDLTIGAVTRALFPIKLDAVELDLFDADKPGMDSGDWFPTRRLYKCKSNCPTI